MIAYLDASALTKVFLDEVGAPIAREVWNSDLPLLTARLAHTELVCALTAAARNRRIERDRIAPELVDGSSLWRRVSAVETSGAIVLAASALGSAHGLRALDAIHVASALSLREAGPTLVSWDRAQRRAAAAEGLPVYP